MIANPGLSYKRNKPDEFWDVIVIGSGIGGMTAASIIAREGKKKVLLLERHYVLGGFTHTFTRKKFEWDVGVHYIGQVMHPKNIIRRFFDYLSDSRLQWNPMPDVYDRIVVGDQAYPFPKGRENLRAALKGWFPGEEKAIDGYFDAVRDCMASVQKYMMEKALPPLVAKVSGPFLRRPFLKWSDRTVAEVLSSLTSNKRLQTVLAGQYGDYGTPPSEASFAVHSMVANHYFDGAAYPVGGSASMARTIIPPFEAAGGSSYINAEVRQIVMEWGKAVGVEMADGRIIRAPVIISDAGLPNTLLRLMPKEGAEKTGLMKVISGVRRSPAHLGLYVGLDQTDAELGFDGANIWAYPDDDHEAHLRRYVKDPSGPMPVAYISFPSFKDPLFQDRCPGKSTVEVVTVTSWDLFSKWAGTRHHRRGEEYDAFKERLANSLLDALYRHVPQARGHVEYHELSTPLSTAHFSNYEQGEIYGLDHTPNRFRHKIRAQTGIPGLFITGQDLVTCGVGGALMGGVMTASAVLERNVMMDILKRSA